MDVTRRLSWCTIAIITNLICWLKIVNFYIFSIFQTSYFYKTSVKDKHETCSPTTQKWIKYEKRLLSFGP